MPLRASVWLTNNAESSDVRACDAWLDLLTGDQYLCLLRSHVQTAATTCVTRIINASGTVDDRVRQVLAICAHSTLVLTMKQTS